jgi:hypothetical protein
MVDNQRSKFWSTLLLLILSFGLRLAGFVSTGTGQGALGARTVFISTTLLQASSQYDTDRHASNQGTYFYLKIPKIPMPTTV